MIEITIKDYLNRVLSAPAYLEHPDGEAVPAKHVMVEKVGSDRTDHINSASIALQSYGASLYEAMSLNEEVKAAMDAITSLKEIGSSSLDSDYNFTDTDVKKYRYQALFDIVHY